MDNKRPILLGSLFAGFSMLLVMGYLKVKNYEYVHDFGGEVPVVIAADDIPEYTNIKPEMLGVATVFKKFRDPQTVTEISQIVGRSAFIPIQKGEQVSLTKLVNTDKKPLLDREIDKQMRAVTLTVTPVSGVGKLVRPGNRVDVLISPTYTINGETILEVKTLVQDALVLATGKTIHNDIPTRVNRRVLSYLQDVFEGQKRKDYFGNAAGLNQNRPDDSYTTLTIEVNPKDAERLVYVSQKYGDKAIFFSLRNTADTRAEALSTVLLDDILGPNSDYGRSKQKPPPEAPPKPPPFYDIQGGEPVVPN